jgi:hypothetical protein
VPLPQQGSAVTLPDASSQNLIPALRLPQEDQGDEDLYAQISPDPTREFAQWSIAVPPEPGSKGPAHHSSLPANTSRTLLSASAMVLRVGLWYGFFIAAPQQQRGFVPPSAPAVFVTTISLPQSGFVHRHRSRCRSRIAQSLPVLRPCRLSPTLGSTLPPLTDLCRFKVTMPSVQLRFRAPWTGLRT